MKTAVLELPQNFSNEKLQSLATLLDVKIIAFYDNSEELDDETLQHIEEGLNQAEKGMLTPHEEVQRKMKALCMQ